MIEKVVEISNVGKLRQHAAVGDQTFKKLTIVYGDNAIGKTTLAAVLDSLREGTAGTILGRKTLGASGEPTVRILSSAGMHTFSHGEWDSTCPELEVFCSDFVSRVVYSGDHVSNDQQKGLCSLLIGRTAVAEGQRLEELRQELNDVNARLRDVEAGIRSHIRGTSSVGDFVGLQPLEDVDALLDEAKRKFAAARDIAAIASKPLPTRVHLLSPDEGPLRSVMARSIDSISVEAIARVAAHRQQRMAGAGGSWLREGMKYVDEARCPFCDQSLDDSELYAALRQYFSAAYEDYERSLNADLGALLEQYDPTTLERDAERVLRQRDVARTWEGQVPKIDVPALSTDLAPSIELAVNSCAAIRTAIEMKKGDPLRAVDFAPIEEHLRLLKESLGVVQRAEAQLGAASNEITDFVAAVQSADLVGLQRQIDQLHNQKQRYEGAVSSLCVEFSELTAKKAKITADGQAARQQMNQGIESLLARYRDDMNTYLKHFGSAIRIENPRANHQTKPPSVDYSISVGGISVPLGKPAVVKDVPCFGNTLSDGEKNLFALALFMAHVKNRADLADVVVVVDDPVNSLDQERRLLIADTLVSMMNSLSQVVVLTHEPRLAHMLYRATASDVRKVLCIRREGTTSCVREWDTMDRDLATDYFRNYFTIADYVAGEAVSWEVASRSLRPFLEDYLRQRFPGEFGAEDWLGSMAERIESADPAASLACMKPSLSDIKVIAKATNHRHHGSTHAPGDEVLNATSTELYAKKALKVIG